EGLGDGELLLHAERVVADLLRGFRIQTDSLHRSRGLVLGDQAADAGQIDEISQPCHTADIGGPVDDDPHVGRKVPPVALQRRFQLNDSLIGSVQPDDHLEEDRLPGAVGALQPRYRPGPDLHRGVLEQGELAELLGDVTEDDRGSVHRLLSGWGRSRFGRVHRATISNRGKRRARRSSSIPNTRTVLAASAAVVGCSHAPSPPLATGAGHTGLTSGSVETVRITRTVAAAVSRRVIHVAHSAISTVERVLAAPPPQSIPSMPQPGGDPPSRSEISAPDARSAGTARRTVSTSRRNSRTSTAAAEPCRRARIGMRGSTHPDQRNSTTSARPCQQITVIAQGIAEKPSGVA